MKSKLAQLLVTGALLAGSSLANALPSNVSLPDAAVARNVQQKLLAYGNYGMFDEVSFQVHARQITLTGSVTQPFKKADIEKLASKVAGVQGVTDNIQVLPFSDADNALRQKIATAFYNDPTLSRDVAGDHSSIHVIVNQGHATLVGAVPTQNDKNDAALLAGYAGSAAISNNLQVVPSL